MESKIIDWFVKARLDNPTLINVVGGIVGAVIIAFFAYVSGQIQNRKSEEDKNQLLASNKNLNDSLSRKNDELARISNENSIKLQHYAENIDKYAKQQRIDAQKREVADQEVKQLQSQLIAQQQKIVEAQREVIDYQKGGDSFCYVLIYPTTTDGFPDPKSHTASVFLFTVGKFPLYGVNVTIYWTPFREDSELMSESGVIRASQELRANTWHTPTLNEVSPQMSYNIVQLPWKLNGTFTIHFGARNGNWIQSYDIRSHPDGSYKISYEVKEGINGNGKVLIAGKLPAE